MMGGVGNAKARTVEVFGVRELGETRELRRCGSGRQETKAKPGGKPRGHRPKSHPAGCRGRRRRLGSRGGGGGGRDRLRRLAGGGGAKGRRGGSPRCLEAAQKLWPWPGLRRVIVSLSRTFTFRPQPICSVGFLPDIRTGRGKGGPHQHDPVNLCGIASGSLRRAGHSAQRGRLRGGTRRPRCWMASVL